MTAPKKEKRRHPRFELYASVELRGAGETLILPARNLSLGGVSLAADGHDLSSFADGRSFEVMIFDAVDEANPPVRAPAKVIRHDADGMALMWTISDPEMSEKLARLLETLKPKKKK